MKLVNGRIHRLSQYKLNSSFKLILCNDSNVLPHTPLPIPLLQPFDSKEKNKIRAQMSSGDETIFCAPGLTHFFLLMLGEGSTQRHQKSVRCKKGRGISECRKLALSFLESVVYRHNFEVLI